MAKSCCENWEAITTNILTIECVMDDDPGIFPMPWLTNDNHLKASIDQIVCISVNKTRTTQYTLSIVNIANCQTSGLAASTIGTICTRQYFNLTSFSFTIRNDFKIDYAKIIIHVNNSDGDLDLVTVVNGKCLENRQVFAMHNLSENLWSIGTSKIMPYMNWVLVTSKIIS